MGMQGLKFADIDDCIISTVVPQSLFNQRNLARRYLNVEPFVIGENVELGIPVRIPKPSEVGADRLVNAIGAHALYPGPADRHRQRHGHHLRHHRRRCGLSRAASSRPGSTSR